MLQGFKSDMWKPFGFLESRNEAGEKVTDRQEIIVKHSRTKTDAHLQHFLAQILTSLFKKK